MRSTFQAAMALGLVALITWPVGIYAANMSAIAANLEHFWSYGRSPPVYPTPQMSGPGDWAEAYNYAKGMVAQMTNDEKNSLTYGYTSLTNGCSGNIPNITRLGFPGLCMNDAGNGLRGTEGTNGYPSGIHTGATWNRDLAYARAKYMGAEFRAKGVNMALGPVAGPLGRIAMGGRNWEGMSNDPYLAGQLVYQTISGLQENVIACVKHFILNEQETNRDPPLIPTPGSEYNQSVSSNLDDKTMHELYLWPFQDAIKAGAGSVMCSLQEANGSYACQNSKTLNGLLKGELGFQGFVVTDWGAQKSGLASAEAGLDMAMPSSAYWENGNLSVMVHNGSLSKTRLDDMVTRILASWYKYAQIADPGFGMPIDLLAPHEFVDARDPASAETILQTAIEGHVLVKNVDGALPLQKPKMISLFGYDGIVAAQNTPTGGGISLFGFGLNGAQVLPDVGDFNATYMFELFASAEPYDAPAPGVALNGTLISGGGSGSITPAYIDTPFDAFRRQAQRDGTFLSWDFYNQNPTINAASEACIVFINALGAEGWDRPTLSDSYSDRLVENVAANCSNTHVVMHNAGIRLVDRWIDNPNITSVIYAHLPGQDSGQALVDVMYGHQSPSGRLPYTVAKKATDYGKSLKPSRPENSEMWHPQSNFTEGVYIDYKHFIAQNITPRFEFGYGLTYSTFAYSGLQIQQSSSEYPMQCPTNSSVPAEGGDPMLWETVATVSSTITNTGSVAAAEVAQLYVNIPGGPAKVLRGFEKVYLAPGASGTVDFELTQRDLSYWDVVSQSWVLQRGTYQIYVGKSVLDVQLQGGLSI